MNGQGKKRLPIGYWLKRADELLTKRIDEAQRANGLTRLEWQALNAVRERPGVSRGQIVELLRPFADETAVERLLGDLADRGLVDARAEGGLELTQAGRERYERALALQKVIRERAVAGITEADYATAVGVLQRLVENLELDESP